MRLVSKRDAEVYREATLRHELVGQWHFAGLKRWALVAMVAGGTCVFGLAPFLVLTPLFLLIGILASNDGIAVMALMAMAMNVGGSIGDLMVARKVRQLGGGTLFEDTADGFNWYRPLRPNL